ncbi:hypothetical protein SAMN05216390_104105 [Lachnospiraceae bacterium KH1T2]|nr:hypothetical protein SAMN05216390_104105 [Lachnospiraceae bacterium KH1T2]
MKLNRTFISSKYYRFLPGVVSVIYYTSKKIIATKIKYKIVPAAASILDIHRKILNLDEFHTNQQRPAAKSTKP